MPGPGTNIDYIELEDVGTTIPVSVAFHLPKRDGAFREPLPTAVSPPPDVRDALILDFFPHSKAWGIR
ncbi:uncharacterized protein Dvar_57750 [Desulfosarcina variabilis str. Montpellier]